ncbi:MAG: hypothetical protein WBD24_02380 [Candidatus Omnitrophota bacterium]
MRTYKCIFAGILATFMAVGYVHQQVEIVKTGYDLQKNRENLSCLVDQNSKLMYNLFKLESPRNLLASMNSEKISFAGHITRPENDRRYRISRTDVNKDRKAESLIGRFLDLFAMEAEASD